MATFSFFGKSIELPATLSIERASTRDSTAWQHGQYSTVRLLGPVEVLRVHTDGKSYPGREASGEAGAWVLIGDVIQTSGDVADSRSLPTANPRSMVAFTHTSEGHLRPDTVLNIGLASPKFGGVGGAFQAEYVSGPAIIFVPLTGKRWHGSSGVA